MAGERELNEDTVDGGIVVETADAVKQLRLRDVCWVVEQFAANAGLFMSVAIHLSITEYQLIFLQLFLY